MTTIEEHLEIVKELEEDIEEKLRRGLLGRKQKLIGFASSECATNSFAVFLHKKKLISTGFNINHSFFISLKRAKDRFKFDFPKKEELFSLLVRQEFFRENLCYGKQKDEKIAFAAVKNYYKIKEIIGVELKNE